MANLLHRLALIAASGTLVAGLGAGVVTMSARPALADTCSDGTNSPAGVFSDPKGMFQIGTLKSGVQVTGDCFYSNYAAQGRWYMSIYYQGKDDYVWVQRLIYGSQHECLDGQNVYTIGSEHCPLQNS
ncbi:MAG TPA: hypothetical protein VGG25_19145 [Streptosporangiaceae bacterium]|jgi:hypothetical protein